MYRLRSVGRWVLVLLAVVVGALVGLAALLGTAIVATAPPVFLGAGLVAFMVVAFGGVCLVTSGLGRQRRGVVRAWVMAASSLLGVAGLVLALLPLRDAVIPPAPVPGQQFWQLARDGFDVWVYDQLGVGRSARLHDPSGYSVGRDAADLEATRQRIGAQRLVPVGYSYGTTVATAYLAQHPDRVERVVFSSPGPLRWPGAPVGGGLFARLDPSRRRRLYAAVLQPRVLLAWLLVQVNPKPPTPWSVTRSWAVGSICSPTWPPRECPATAARRGRRVAGAAPTPIWCPRPCRPPPALTLARRWPSCARRRWLSRAPATTCRGLVVPTRVIDR